MSADLRPNEPRVHGWPHGHDEHPYQVGLACIGPGHISIELVQPGAWWVDPDNDPSGVPWACWCLWCGSGVSNESVPEQDGEFA